MPSWLVLRLHAASRHHVGLMCRRHAWPGTFNRSLLHVPGHVCPCLSETFSSGGLTVAKVQLKVSFVVRHLLQSQTMRHVQVVPAEFDREKRRRLQLSGQRRQPLVVSAFLPRQTGWLRLGPGESAPVTPKTWAMTHLWSPPSSAPRAFKVNRLFKL